MKRLVDIFSDFYYLSDLNLSHTHSIEDKIIDKDYILLARVKEAGA